jgi:serine/threonine-protein kinase
MLIHVGLSSLDNRSGVTELTRALDNFLVYDNSTYGIRFLSPDDWDKMEILTDRTTFVEFTSPSRNVTEGIELPGQVVISIEKGLGNVTTLQQYVEAGDKLLNTILGNFTATSQPITLSGLPAISRTIATKNPASGIDISIAQIIVIKNDNAYTITYTAPSSTYYNYLSTVQQIINSFQITK